MNFETIIEYGAIILAVVAGICVLVSVITEFTKEISFLKKIPTTLQVLVLSLVVCILGFFAYISYAEISFVWYHLVAVIFSGFIIALICSKGWDYFIDIVERFYVEKYFSCFKNSSKNKD